MSDAPSRLLHTLNEEIRSLADALLPRTVELVGMTRDLLADVSGSGFLLDGDGHITTNNHVVEGLGPSVWVAFPDMPRTRGEVLGTDPVTDLAVLRVAEHPEKPLPLRDAPAHPGELCLAFGSPLGEYEASVTFGMVSAVGRTLPRENGAPLENCIQTDAAINPGNSGGPLIDVDGAVIGVNTCKMEGGENLGFAVPAATLAVVAAELIEHGSVERASLGVSVAQRFVEIRDRPSRRLVVAEVRSESAAGLRSGDVLLRLDGRDIISRGDLVNLLTRSYVGREVQVEVLREGAPKVVTVVPAARKRS